MGFLRPLDDSHEALDFPQRDEHPRGGPLLDIEVDGDLLAHHAEDPDYLKRGVVVEDANRRTAPPFAAQSLEHVDRQRPGFGVVEVGEDVQGEDGRSCVVEPQFGAWRCRHVSVADGLAGDLVEVLGCSHFPFFPRLMRLCYYTLNTYVCQYAYDKNKHPGGCSGCV